MTTLANSMHDLLFARWIRSPCACCGADDARLRLVVTAVGLPRVLPLCGGRGCRAAAEVFGIP